MQNDNIKPTLPGSTGTGLPESVADMPLNVHVTLGRTNLTLKEIFKITVGSVIVLGQRADEPVDLVANGKVTARGTLVITRGNYGLKVVSKVTNDKPGR